MIEWTPRPQQTFFSKFVIGFFCFNGCILIPSAIVLFNFFQFFRLILDIPSPPPSPPAPHPPAILFRPSVRLSARAIDYIVNFIKATSPSTTKRDRSLSLSVRDVVVRAKGGILVIMYSDSAGTGKSVRTKRGVWAIRVRANEVRLYTR